MSALINHYCMIVRMAEEENMEWDEEQLKEKETTIMQIGKMYRDDGNAKASIDQSEHSITLHISLDWTALSLKN